MNRIEPVLADLEQALSESRVRYLWHAITAGAAVASGPIAPSIATSAAGTFVTHSLAYAFSRRRLVEQHPFGFLHEARRAFTPNAQTALALPAPRQITDPRAEVRTLWVHAMAKAVNYARQKGVVDLGSDHGMAALVDGLDGAWAELDKG